MLCRNMSPAWNRQQPTSCWFLAWWEGGSRMPVDSSRTTQHCVSEDRTLQIIVIVPSSIRHIETHCRYCTTDTFCHFRSFLKLFSFFCWYYKIVFGVLSDHFFSLCCLQFLCYCSANAVVHGICWSLKNFLFILWSWSWSWSYNPPYETCFCW
jgi:hypothetical protein